MSKDTAPGQNKPIVIIVNGQEKTYEGKEIGYKDVIILAFDKFEDNPLIVYTIDYMKGENSNKEGTMESGDTVKIKPGMIFDVTRTDKS